MIVSRMFDYVIGSVEIKIKILRRALFIDSIYLIIILFNYAFCFCRLPR